MTSKPTLKQRLTALGEEYGPVAFVVWFTLFFATLGGFWFAVSRGWQPESASGTTGTLMIAYVASQATKPIRIAATVVLTPIVARVLRLRRQAAGAPPGPDAPAP
jgi:ABC-type transport system involved in cytochrome c biogenesis permease component